MKNKRFSLVLVAMVLGTLVFTACPTVETTPPVDRTVTLNFDFSGTFDPDFYGVTPFLVGGVSAIIAGSADWDACPEAGIFADGTGSQVMTKDGSVYSIVITLPSTAAAIYDVKPANYSTNGYTALTNDFWNVVGALNSGIENIKLTTADYKVSEIVLDGDTNIGTTISADGKTVTFDIGTMGGWTVHVPGNTTADINVVLIATNVPTSGISGANLASLNLWYPLMSVASNTNTGATTSAIPVVTGNNQGLHTTTSTWTPAEGEPVTINAGTQTVSVAVTIPSGSSQGLQWKVANILGWDRGEMPNNQFLPLPQSSAITITNIVDWMN